MSRLAPFLVAPLLALSLIAPAHAEPTTWEPARWPRVLAEAAGARVTEADLRATFFLHDLLTGREMNAADRKASERELIASFEKGPVEFRASYDTIHQLLDAVAKAGSAELVAQTRFLLLGPVLLGAKADPEARKSAFGRSILRALPIVAQSADGAAVLTRPDLDGFLELMELQDWLDGAPKTMSATRKRELERFFIETFPTMEAEQRLLVGSGSVIWTAVTRALGKLSASDRGELERRANEARARRQAEERAAKASAAATKQAPVRDARYYRMMSEMMARQHATSMNILSNIGGGEYYYEYRARKPWE